MSDAIDNPTPKGRLTYPPDGYFICPETGEKIPCICEETCSNCCEGECGCEACFAWYLESK